MVRRISDLEERTHRVLTAFWRQLLEVDLQGDVVLRFGLWLEKRAVFSPHDLVDTIPHELVPTADVHGECEDSLAVSSGHVEADAIEVDELDI